MNPDNRPRTSYNASHHGIQSLPPITALTSDLPPPEPSPNTLRRRYDDPTRDSGNFSLASQSKRESLSTYLPPPFLACDLALSRPVRNIYLNIINLLPDSSAISSASGLHLQTILNSNDNSPPRNAMPETPHSVRGSFQAYMLVPTVQTTLTI